MCLDRSVIACCGKRVKIFDAVSGELLRVLGTNYELSGAVLDYTSPETRLVCVGKGGEVLSVSLVEGEETRLLGKVDRGLGSILASGQLIFALSTDRQKVYQVVLAESGSTQRPKIFPVVKGSKAMCGIACNGTRLAYASGKRLWVWDCQEDVSRKAVETVEVPHVVTALAWFGPKDLVLGYAHGAMAVIRDMATGSLAAALERQTQSLHWHSDAVRALAGSVVDGYVLSGGNESVGVQWGLGRGVSGVRSQFLPRLGAPVRWAAVSGDGSMWILGLDNNAMVVVGSESFRPVCYIRGLAIASTAEGLPGFMHVSPHDPGHVILPGGLGAVQVFDAVHDKHISRLPITQENLVSSLPENRQAVKHRSIRHLALHGIKLMATFEAYEGSAGTLRFWVFDAETVAYEQVAVVDAPHGKRAGPITALAFKPNADVELGADLLTADGQGHVRLWQCKMGYWSASIKLRLGLKPITDIDCSEDGSLVACACGPSVLLADGRSLAFLRALTYSRTDEMRAVRFLGLSGRLACHDGAQLSVWDLEGCGLAWSLIMPVRSMAVQGTKLAVSFPSPQHPGEDYTILFRADSPIPVLARRHPATCFSSLAFLQAKRRDAKTKCKTVLFGLCSADGCLAQAFPEAEPVDEPVITAGPSWGRSALAQELLAVAHVALERLQPTEVPPQWDAPQARPRELLLMEVPSHVLPSMRLLSAAFFKLRLPPA